MSNEKVSQLPSVTSAALTDVIYAIQAGTSSQETLQQVYNLFQSTVILSFAGNPNTNVAGTIYQLLWDTTDNFLWICTSTGSSLTAIWKPCIGALTNGQLAIGSTGQVPLASTITAGANIVVTNNAGHITIASLTAPAFSWTVVNSSNMNISSNNGYLADFSGGASFLLPSTSSVGDQIAVVGIQGWSIAQNSSQYINLGSQTTTVGISGSLTSSNNNDVIYLVCTVADTGWTATNVIGNIAIV